MGEYPECEKWAATREERLLISRFLDWLWEHSEARLAQYHGEKLVACNESLDSLLAGFFGVDMDKLELERQALLSNATVKP